VDAGPTSTKIASIFQISRGSSLPPHTACKHILHTKSGTESKKYLVYPNCHALTISKNMKNESCRW